MPTRRTRENDGRHDGETERLSLTPMIDVTFLILIFFMCTMSFTKLAQKFDTYLPWNKGLGNQDGVLTPIPEIQVSLPDSQRGLPPEEQTVVFKRTGIGAAILGRGTGWSGSPAHVRFDPPDTMRRITDYLASVRAQLTSRPTFKIKADPDVPHAYVVNLIDAGRAARYAGIDFGGISNARIESLKRRLR